MRKKNFLKHHIAAEKEEGVFRYNAQAYNKIYKIYNLKHSEIYNSIEQERLKRVISGIVSNKNISVLDVGAGTGNLALKFLSSDSKVTAADVSVNSLELLKQLSNNNQNLKTITLTDNKLPFEDNSFDVVATYSVLHHIPNYLLTVQEMLRVTKKGGLIYIDHEHNETKWFPTKDLNEYYSINKKGKFYYLKVLYKTRELFTFGFIKEMFIRTFLNKKYEKEGDVHVWPDDHINWDKIKEIFLKDGHKILTENNYLLYRPEAGLIPYNKYKNRCNDIKYIIVQK
jgi:ubiquinone/menaquinone biosynthesis C-methylase UbiE